MKTTSIPEINHIDQILDHPDIQSGAVSFFFDFDNTLVKLDEAKNKYIGSDEWYSTLLAYAKARFSDDLMQAFIIATTLNDEVHKYVFLKPAEKKTLETIKFLQETLKTLVVIVTARGFTLMPQTEKQLKDVNLTIDHQWTTHLHNNNPVELLLDFNFHSVSQFSTTDDKNIPFKYAYVFVEETQQLFYFNRTGNRKEITITNLEDFQSSLSAFLGDKKHVKISQQQVRSIIEKNCDHHPDKHAVTYYNGVIYCEGHDKGDATIKFKEWAQLKKKCCFIDDKKHNVDAVKFALEKNGDDFFGWHYTHVKIKNDPLVSSYTELDALYPHLSDEAKEAIVTLDLPLPSLRNPSCLFAVKAKAKQVVTSEENYTLLLQATFR